MVLVLPYVCRSPRSQVLPGSGHVRSGEIQQRERAQDLALYVFAVRRGTQELHRQQIRASRNEGVVFLSAQKFTNRLHREVMRAACHFQNEF
nr:unnamed protein product [Callosobruchus analis]